MTTVPDYSTLKLKGNMQTQNSFALTIQAAARLLGKEADYQDIYAWSTAPFAPCFQPEEPTKHWWAMCQDGGLFEIISGRLGLKVDFQQVDWSQVPELPAEGAERDRLIVVHAAMPAIAYAREAMSEGKVCLSSGAWPSRNYPWCMWGIVTEVRSDKEWVGAGINGRTDIPILTSCGHQVWALSSSEPKLTERQADLRLFKAAVRRIRGEADSKLAGYPMVSGVPFSSSKRRVYGIDAMDRWIEEMSKVPWSRDPNEKGNGGAGTTAAWVQIGSRCAGAYLRNAASTFGTTTRGHLNKAAEQYERIVALLDPAITGKGGYEVFMGDLAKQKAHVKTVLEPVREAFLQAADEMEKALAVEGIDVIATSAVEEGRALRHS